jgi:hypothetical protein
MVIVPVNVPANVHSRYSAISSSVTRSSHSEHASAVMSQAYPGQIPTVFGCWFSAGNWGMSVHRVCRASSKIGLLAEAGQSSYQQSDQSAARSSSCARQVNWGWR